MYLIFCSFRADSGRKLYSSAIFSFSHRKGGNNNDLAMVSAESLRPEKSPALPARHACCAQVWRTTKAEKVDVDKRRLEKGGVKLAAQDSRVRKINE